MDTPTTNPGGANASTVVNFEPGSAGLPDGKYRQLMNITGIVFGMSLTLMIMGGGWALLNHMLTTNDKREERLTKLLEGSQVSVNANNHNMAGMTNVVNQLIEEVRILRSDVKALNKTTRAATEKIDPLAHTIEPPLAEQP